VSEYDELIEEAAALLNPVIVDGRWFGDVASVLVSGSGVHHGGVCIDTGSGTGFCAEASAIASMVTAGERQIGRIVAVWRDPDTGELAVLPPCGRCRLFISQLHPSNRDTVVVLGVDDALTIEQLVPRLDWPEPLPERFTHSPMP
jgi:cytidine deaminase